MQILRTCADPGCSTLCMGFFCIAHDRKETRTFVRGRPFLRQAAAAQTTLTAALAPRPRTRGRNALASTP